MKKLLCCLIAVCVMLLCGCGNTSNDPDNVSAVEVLSNDKYSVMESNGEYYLSFNDNINITTGSTQTGAATPGTTITFKSVKDMRDAIVNGDFSSAQLTGMQNFAKASNGSVAVCNVNELWDVVYPQDLSLEWISWTGPTYCFRLSNDVLEGNVYFTSKSNYEKRMRRAVYEETETFKFTSIEADPERNGTIMTYESQKTGRKGKQIVYTYSENGFDFTVSEKYFFEHSETIPFLITTMAEGNGIYYYWNIGGFTERPSYEWIKSIGVTPYVETE